MNVKKYLKKKNALLHKYTDIWLIPKDQIVNVKAKPLSMYDDALACPYCIVYDESYKKILYTYDCKGCPMDNANNNCHGDDSTYSKLTEVTYHVTNIRAPWNEKLHKLIKKFNKSNGFKFKDIK